MSMTLYQLKSFVTVAKHQSFTLAAEALKVRQPSATLIIQSLERELDVKLFERLGNKIHLTNAGEALLQEAEPIVTRAEGIREKMEEVKGMRKGKIAVGGSGTAAAAFLPLAVQAFKNNYPKIEIIFKIHRSSVLEKQLLEGDLDLAVLGWPSSSSRLVSEPYYREEIVIIAPPNHPLTKKRIVSLESLAKEPLILQEKGTNIRRMVEEKFTEKRLPFVPVQDVDTQFLARDAIKGTVASGLGLAFLPRCHVAGDVQAGRLKLLKVPELTLERTLYMVTHKTPSSPSLPQSFVDFLWSYCKDVV